MADWKPFFSKYRKLLIGGAFSLLLVGLIALWRFLAVRSARRKCFLVWSAIVLFFAGSLVVGSFLAIRVARENISNAETSLRFGAIGDFEYGTRNKVGNKLVSLAPSELEKVIGFYNAEWRPVFVVEMGDMVESSGVKRTKALDQFRFIDSIFRKVEARTEYLLGNHDLRSLSKEEVRGVLGLADNHRYFDEGAWRFVLMDTNFDPGWDEAHQGPSFYIAGFVSESEFAWLEEAFATDRPIVLFSHHPLHSGGKLLNNSREMLAFLRRFPNVVLAVSGHDPSFRFIERDGIAHLTVDNLANTDSVGSFATLDARYNPLTKEARVLVEHYGPSRNTVEAKRKLPGERAWWVDALDRFGLLS